MVTAPKETFANHRTICTVEGGEVISGAFAGAGRGKGVVLSMNSIGTWRDNVLVELPMSHLTMTRCL